MNQNLSSYWIFYTVANAGNISKAAKELYISQPAISKSIQKSQLQAFFQKFPRGAPDRRGPASVWSRKRSF